MSPRRRARRIPLLVVAAALCLAAASDRVGGEVRLAREVAVDLEVTPTSVVAGEQAVATASASAVPAVRHVTVELHAPEGSVVRPRASRVVRRPKGGDLSVDWRVCRDVPGAIGLAVSVSWDDSDGTRRTIISDTAVLHVLEPTGPGRRCGGP